MNSREAYNYFLNKGFPVDSCVFNKFDTIERNADLENLFDVLASVKNGYGKSPVFTANTIVCNPDFARIETSGFESYAFSHFTESLKQFPDADNVFSLYHQGASVKLFRPQFHGREHVHVPNWLKSLQSNDVFSKEAFKYGMFTVTRKRNSSCKAEFLDAYASYSKRDSEFIANSISEGLAIFERLFGYSSKTAISPCYIWNDAVSEELARGGVTSLQSGRVQLLPVENSDGYLSSFKYMGEANLLGQKYLIRNIYFETCTDQKIDWVSLTIKRIQKSFMLRTPAIISSHRVNYMGGIDPSNRERGLLLLKKLLNEIVRRWPEVEFMTSDELADAIHKNDNL